MSFTIETLNYSVTIYMKSTIIFVQHEGEKVYITELSLYVAGFDEMIACRGYQYQCYKNCDNRLCSAEIGRFLLLRFFFVAWVHLSSKISHGSAVFQRPGPRALKGLLIMSGLRGLIGIANRSSSASLKLDCRGTASPLRAASRDIGPDGRLREMAEKDDTAMSPPRGDSM